MRQKRYKKLSLVILTGLLLFSTAVQAHAWPWSRKKKEDTATEAATEVTTEAAEKKKKTTSKSTDKKQSEKPTGGLAGTSKTGIDIIDYMEAYSSVQFQVSREQKDFIEKNARLFPAGKNDREALEKRIDRSLDYKHIKKNPQKYVGQFAYIDRLRIDQIWETSLPDAKEYDYVTVINGADENEDRYRIFYFGRSLDAVEGDEIWVTAMPIAGSSFKSLDGRTVLTVVMLASAVQGSGVDDIVTTQIDTDSWEVQAAQKSVHLLSPDEYMLPDSSKKRLTATDIADLSETQLRIAKNEIYARHGRMFTSEDLRIYFTYRSWYQGTIPADQFKESVLSQIEKDNIALLQAHIDPAMKDTGYASRGLSFNGYEAVPQKLGTYCYYADPSDKNSLRLELTVKRDGPADVVFYEGKSQVQRTVSMTDVMNDVAYTDRSGNSFCSEDYGRIAIYSDSGTFSGVYVFVP